MEGIKTDYQRVANWRLLLEAVYTQGPQHAGRNCLFVRNASCQEAVSYSCKSYWGVQQWYW